MCRSQVSVKEGEESQEDGESGACVAISSAHKRAAGGMRGGFT